MMMVAHTINIEHNFVVLDAIRLSVKKEINPKQLF